MFPRDGEPISPRKGVGSGSDVSLAGAKLWPLPPEHVGVHGGQRRVSELSYEQKGEKGRKVLHTIRPLYWETNG